MKYPAQSDIWRLDHVIRPQNGASNGASLVNHGQSRVLGRFRQIFPLSLFCDDLIIEELRIVHVKKNGPWAYEVISIMATDIASVNASSGLFFGQVHIKSLTGGPEIFVDNMLRRHIYKIRSLVEGIALSSREGLRLEHQSSLEAERQDILAAGSVHYR